MSARPSIQTIQIMLDGRSYRADLSAAWNLAIALYFDEPHFDEPYFDEPHFEDQHSPSTHALKSAQPNAFHLAAARATPARAAGFVGDTRQGGSMNCADIGMNPHGNGTHTECVGHLVDEAVGVGELATAALIPAVILSVAPQPLAQSSESYDGLHDPADRVITKDALQSALKTLRAADSTRAPKAFFEAIIIRTLPNPVAKKTRTYSGTNPCYPTADAIQWCLKMGCEHLLVDLPSLDREDDGATLPNHHRFFALQPGKNQLDGAPPSPRTVTEMAYIPDSLADCIGLLNLQLPRFALDAAPSRPLFFEVGIPQS